MLSDQGVYICISYGVSASRLAYFAKPEYDWGEPIVAQVAKPTVNTSQVVAEKDQNDKNFH